VQSDDELYLELESTNTKPEDKKKESKESKEQRRQRKLAKSGPCPAGYDWCRRQGCFSQSCMKCGLSPDDGYQCAAGSHWMCMACTDKL
jgi:hypothetical protein